MKGGAHWAPPQGTTRAGAAGRPHLAVLTPFGAFLLRLLLSAVFAVFLGLCAWGVAALI